VALENPARRSAYFLPPRTTLATCDQIARLDVPGKIKSLNVSNAAALALYLATTRLAAKPAR
jgi:tRNA G18 (ribose-2'-O)-methylase SpoU